MTKKIVNEEDLRKHALYNELREKFDYWHVCLALRPNAAPEWWAPDDGVEYAQDGFIVELAYIIEKYIKADIIFDDAYAIVSCELDNIKDYADRLSHRMYDLELANYARDKFLNDLIDAVENGFGEI